MKIFNRRSLLLGTVLMMASVLYASSAFAGISSVVRGGTQPAEPNCAPAIAGSLATGSTSYCDRDTAAGFFLQKNRMKN